MGLRPPLGLTGLIDRQARRRWARAARFASDADLARLKTVQGEARELKRHLNDVLHVADGRLSLPLCETGAVKAPLHSDWAYRPEPWVGPLETPGHAPVMSGVDFGGEMAIFHDCPANELSIRQTRNTGADDAAPFSVRIDVFRFHGSFFSAVIELPAAAVNGLRNRHIVHLETRIETERPIEIFARLNVRHGPNTEQLVREFAQSDPVEEIGFDLGYTDINENRIERMWLDLIFENPEMNQITLRDLTLSRRPRAEL